MTQAVAKAEATGMDGPTVSRKSTPEYITGRRAFFKYREMGVSGASGGKFRVQVMSTEKGLSEPTGWPYHVCEGQFVFMLSGWVDLVFENISNPKTWPKALKCLRKFGTLVTAGAHGGGKVELDCAFLYHQNIRIFGSTGSTDQNVSDTVALASEGKLKAKIEKIFPLSEIPAAHRMMEGEVLSGKIVLDPTAG